VAAVVVAFVAFVAAVVVSFVTFVAAVIVAFVAFVAAVVVAFVAFVAAVVRGLRGLRGRCRRVLRGQKLSPWGPSWRIVSVTRMIHLDGNSLTLDDLVAIAVDAAPVSVTEAARARVRAARDVVDEFVRGDRPVYGINTGFGNFAEVRIPSESLDELQVNLLRSHAAGVGELLPVPVVRATMALRANVLAKGFSGIRLETLDALLDLLNRGVHPVVPSRGSVGASGDLAPLAHLALVLIGEGEAWHGERRLPGADALARVGLTPVTLAPKEGLALINGTQASTALLGLAASAASCLARAADVTAAMSIDGLQGSTKPFDPRIHDARGVPGQSASADNLRHLLEGSAINAAHANCGRVQDAYSMRCAPQVHGAAREAICSRGPGVCRRSQRRH
jgi:histidine ammonia-lyase